MSIKNETARPAEFPPKAGEVKRMAGIDVEAQINRVKTSPNFELSLFITEDREKKIDLTFGVRPGPSYEKNTDEWAITDGEVELLKHTKLYDYPTTDDDVYVYKITDFSIIMKFRHFDRSWDSTETNSMTVISTDEALIERLAKEFKEHMG